ncbi:BF3164 family lipoprotein [uncultured Rikenella sp.]|uniref:BF3164 family lipoprotein n=1 Tax=uncultured Rikenella sp. TaxID=368003 RepID=UPI00261C4A75|nr:BF3164 family lipoprotein [uncultured Rikenella sp.]
MKKILTLSLIAMLCWGCGETSQTFDGATLFDNASFPETKTLHGEVFPLGDPTLIPYDVTVIDSLLMIVPYPNSSSRFVKIYDTEKQRITGSFLSQGRGPGELIGLDKVGYTPGKSFFWCYDMTMQQILIYNKSDLAHFNDDHSLIMPVQSVQIEFIGTSPDIYRTPDGRFIESHIMTPVKRFSEFDTKGRFVRSFGEYPTYPGLNVTEDRLLGELFDGKWTIDDSTGRLVFACLKTDLISIYDSTGRVIKHLYGPAQRLPEFKVGVSGRNGNHKTVSGKRNETIFNYYDIKNRNGRIWALYQPRLFNPKAEPMEASIYVFDWDGNPVIRYELDMPIYKFDVDPVRRIIYGIKSDTEEILTFKY